MLYPNQFKRDYKLAGRQGRNLALLHEIIEKLAEGGHIEAKYRNHRLSGSMKGYRELHIQPDWLLIYQIREGEDELILLRMGSHSELFR